MAFAADEKFAAEELNLLSAEESATLTQQAKLVHASSTIKSHPSKEEITKLKKFLNSGMFLVNFPMSRPQQDAYLASVSEGLSLSKKVSYVQTLQDKPDGAVLTTLSVLALDKEQSMLEVSIVAFNWEKAASLKEGLGGVIKSTVWYIVSRKVIPLPVAGIKDIGAEPVVTETYKALVKAAFDKFLLAL